MNLETFHLLYLLFIQDFPFWLNKLATGLGYIVLGLLLVYGWMWVNSKLFPEQHYKDAEGGGTWNSSSRP